MISSIGAQAWSAADLTGNSALVTVGSTRYVAGGGHLYASENYGLTWIPLVDLPTSTDPALASDSEGNVHILMAVPTAGSETLSDVVKYVYNTTTKILGAPLTLIHGTRTVSAYDIGSLTAGRVLVVATALEPVGHSGYYCLMAFEVTAEGTFTTTVLQQNHWATGDTFGSITLAGDGELYYTSHSRVFPFKETDVLVLRTLRSAADTWGTPEQIGKYSARYTDDKLTALTLADGQRVLVQAFHRWSRTRGLYTNILYGVGTALSTWSWVSIEATDESDFHEPVVETDGATIYLAYLRNAKLPGTQGYAHTGTMEVSTLDLTTKARTPLSGAWSSFSFRWLRGTKEIVDTGSKWMLIGVMGTETGESDGGMAMFFSQYNLAPTAHLVPATTTLQRGVPLVLDASGTLDPDLDSLTYTWSHDHTDTVNVHLVPSGNSATLLVDKAIGPLATSLVVTVAVSDGIAGHESSATSVVTVPSNSEPVITMDEEMDVHRNTTVGIAASASDADGDYLTYLWSQESGTPVEIEPTPTGVIVGAYRMKPQGEDVVLRLTVQDGVNRPIIKSITLHVSAVPDANVDSLTLTRRFYRVAEDAATIDQRNSLTGFWPSYATSQLRCDLQRMYITTNLAGKERFVYVGQRSVQITSQDEIEVFYRSITPPVEGELVLDGVQDESDQTYLLTDLGNIYCYSTVGPDGCSDWPDDTRSLGDLISGTYTRLEVGKAYSGKRVLALYGGTGLLLVQVYDQGLQVLDVIQISLASGSLPSNRIGFIRMDNVIGLKGGQILIGMWDDQGESLEVLYDLSVRRVVCSWDRTNLISSLVNTGEILVSSDLTSGIPDSPVIQEPELLATNRYQIAWTQSRPDLISGYEVWIGVDAAQPSIYAALPGGSVRRVDLPTKAGHVYHITARSQGSSGMSAFSTERTLTT